jgi:hypothetical protein
MDIDNCTPQALLSWAVLPPEAKVRILKNVFCIHGKTSVEIVDYKGTENGGNVILTGRCLTKSGQAPSFYYCLIT